MTNFEVIEKLGLKKGDTIKIIKMVAHPEMSGRGGVIINITSNGQLQGNWGSLAIVPSADKIEKVE